jgi:hypothetical protein
MHAGDGRVTAPGVCDGIAPEDAPYAINRIRCIRRPRT